MSEAKKVVAADAANVNEKQTGKQWYAAQLKDPRWQKRRLQVFDAAGWKCEWCGNPDETLHVHHLRYSGPPWEAPDDALECLCEAHHKQREADGLPIYFTTPRASTARAFVNCIKAAGLRGITVEEALKRIIKALE